jgi:hypothetical protein
VSVGGVFRGRTPIAFSAARGQPVTLELSLDGHRPVERKLDIIDNATVDVALEPVAPVPPASAALAPARVPEAARPSRPRSRPSKAAADKPPTASPPARASVDVPKW